MKQISIFNHVLGPVMRGPSSSHTAGAFHIASQVRSMLGGTPVRVVCAFDPEGSYAQTYAQQGADRAFAMGLLGRPLTEPAFFEALELAPGEGLDLRFEVRPIPGADHPNMVAIQATGPDGFTLDLLARSIGGGDFEIAGLRGWPVLFNGCGYDLAVEADPDGLDEILEGIVQRRALLAAPAVQRRDGAALVVASRSEGGAELLAEATVKVALQLPEDLAKLLRTRAIQEGVSVSRLVGDWVVQREIEEHIAQGEADIAAGRVHTWEEFKLELDKWR